MQSHPAARRLVPALATLSMLLAGIAPASAQTIATVAGGAVCDDASALATSIAPGGSATDAAGNLYVAAIASHVVCKITPAGAISHVAGTGTAGFGGDGGAATSARLNYPNHVAFDASGNLYIADSGNGRIRKVTPQGIISTIAGGGSDSGEGVAAAAAYLNFPSGIALDAGGNLYIADTVNHRIRKVSASDGSIHTIAGTGSAGYSGDGGAATAAQLNSPYGIALDGAGNVYIADRSNYRVRKVAVAGGAITTVAGDGTTGYSGDGGPATDAKFGMPQSVAVDAAGNTLYIADSSNNRIRKVTTSDGKIASIAGSASANFGGDGGPASAAQLNYPQNVSLDATGNLYVSDYYNYRLRKIAAANAGIATVAGNGAPGWSGDGGAATSAQLGAYLHVAVDAAGNRYISDGENHRIRKVAADGTISTFAGNGTPGFSGDGGAATSAQLNNPVGIALDGAGNLYIADQYNQRVRRVAADGTISTFAGNGSFDFGGDGGAAGAARLALPVGVATDNAGNVYIADASNQRIRKVASDGTISTIAGSGTMGFSGDGGAATAADLNNPAAVQVDRNGNVYIADTYNRRVRKVGTDGKITTIAGTGAMGYDGDGGAATAATFIFPTGLALSPTGELFIADWYTNSVRRISADGTINRLAGSGGGSAGFAGDGGPAIDALLSGPYDAAFDARGNLYVADSANRRVRKIASIYPTPGLSMLIDSPSTAEVFQTVTITITATSDYAVPTGTIDVCMDGDPDPDFFCWPGFKFLCTGVALAPAATAHEYVATCTTSALPAGDHSIGALYSGDAFYYHSTSGNLGRIVVTKASQAITNFVANPTHPTFAANGTFTVSAHAGASTSAVLFASATPAVCSVDSGNGQVTMLTTGTCTLTADQDGDDEYSPAPQVRLDVPLGVAATTTGLTSNGPGVYGQSATLTATVNDAAMTATGTITFREGTTTLCADVALNSLSASCAPPASALTVGGHDFTATYGGDAGHAASTSAPLHHVVDKAATALVVITVAPGSITLGQSATVSIALSATAPGAGTPTGTVTISDGTVSCSFSTPANTHCAITPTDTGARPIGATYSGDANFLASSVAAGFLLVNSSPRTPTTTALSLAPNPATTGQAVIATVDVLAAVSAPTGTGLRANANVSAATATGTVVVSGGNRQCSATLDGNGRGQCTLTYAVPGNYAITADYSGDTQSAPSSANANLTVTAVPQASAVMPAPALSWAAMLAMMALLAAFTRRSIANI